MHVVFSVFLCCVSAVFFPDVDAVRFSHTKDEYVLPVTNRVRYSVLISAAEPVVTAVCSQPGQVAPVTLHRPCGTKHFFPRRTAAPPYEELRRPCHPNMAGGLVNVYNVTVCLIFEPEHLKRYMDDDVPRPGVCRLSIAPLCAQSPLLNEFMLLENPRYKTVHNDR